MQAQSLNSLKENFLFKTVVFCAIMVAARFIKTGHVSFLFLFWNLFLAWLPFWFINRAADAKGLRSGLFALLSVLFMPNAPYLVTDLFHLKKELVAPLWFDVTLIASFAILGLVFFVRSAGRLFRLIESYIGNGAWMTPIKLLVFVMNGYGIYLGRYLRFNSWDIVAQPLELCQGMLDSVFDYEQTKETLAITLTFSVFLYLAYGIYDSLRQAAYKKQHEIF